MARCYHNTTSSIKMVHTEGNHRRWSSLVEKPDWYPESNERIGREIGKPVGIVARIMSDDHAPRGNVRASMDVLGQSLRRLDHRQGVHTREPGGHPAAEARRSEFDT